VLKNVGVDWESNIEWMSGCVSSPTDDLRADVLDTEAHEMVMTYWHRIVPLRSYVEGWKISPNHFLNQDLANVWLDK
jgi:hypothetical protein